MSGLAFDFDAALVGCNNERADIQTEAIGSFSRRAILPFAEWLKEICSDRSWDPNTLIGDTDDAVACR